MKKFVWLLLPALLLTACSGKKAPDTPETTAPTEPAPPALLLAQETTVADGETRETTYSYSPDSLCTGWVTTVDGEIAVTVSLRYDDQGREVSRTELTDGEEWVTHSFYGDNGLLSGRAIYLNSAKSQTDAYAYDDQGHLLTHTEQDVPSGTTRVTANTYENGLLTLQVITSGGAEQQRSEYTYDDSGRVKIIRIQENGSATTVSCEYIDQIETRSTIDSDGNILQTKVIHRDNGGNPATEVITDSEGNTLSTKTYIWQPLE